VAEKPTRIKQSGLLQAALGYAAKGLRVFPVHGINDQGGCTCGKDGCETPGKHPRTQHGFLDATTDQEQIKIWWDQWPGANIGIRTGAITGFFVLDIDGDQGEESLDDLEAQYGKLPDSWQVLTGRGRHIYFRFPDGVSVPSRIGRIGKNLDIRSGGAYAIVPPSRHLSGKPYEWELSSHPDDVPLAAAPEWLIELANRPKGSTGDKVQRSRSSCKAVIHRGTRNDTLFNEATHMRDCAVSRSIVERHILLRGAHDCVPPLSEREIARIVSSVYSYTPRPSTKRSLSESSLKIHAWLTERSLGKGFCDAALNDIAWVAGITKRQASNCVKQLEDFEVLDVRRFQGKLSRYMPLPISDTLSGFSVLYPSYVGLDPLVASSEAA
jgi:hypothetical protein